METERLSKCGQCLVVHLCGRFHSVPVGRLCSACLCLECLACQILSNSVEPPTTSWKVRTSAARTAPVPWCPGSCQILRPSCLRSERIHRITVSRRTMNKVCMLLEFLVCDSESMAWLWWQGWCGCFANEQIGIMTVVVLRLSLLSNMSRSVNGIVPLY